MEIYIIAAIVSLAFSSVDTIVNKLTTKHYIKNPLVFNYYYYPLALLFVLPIPLFIKIEPITTDLPNVLLVSFIGVLAFLGYAYGLYGIDASTIGPLKNLRVVFSAIFAFILLGEKLPADKYVWLVILVICGFLVTLDETFQLSSFFKKPVLLIYGWLIGLSLYSIFSNRGTSSMGFWSFIFWVAIIQFPIASLSIPLFWKEIHIFRRQFIPMFISVSASFLATITAIRAFEGNVTVSTAIVSFPLEILLVFILSRTNPKLLESHSGYVYIVRFCAAALMLICLIFLASI